MHAALGSGTTLRARRLRGPGCVPLRAALRMLALALALAAAQTVLAWHGADFGVHGDDHPGTCEICLHFGGLDSGVLQGLAAPLGSASPPAETPPVSDSPLSPPLAAFRARAPPVPPFGDHLIH